MTVIVSDSSNPSYNGKLLTTNGWYRAEAYNLGFKSYTPTAFSGTTAVSTSITFANAGNCKGVIIALFAPQTYTTNMRSITVNLQSSGTTIATCTLTPAQITNINDSVTLLYQEVYIVPFVFTTAAAVTTAASTYTIQIVQASTPSTYNWSYYTSSGSYLSYVAWCDNAVTATSGSDCLIIKDAISIDGAFTTKAYLGTGDSTYGESIIVCRSTTPATATVANLTWPSAPTSAYTLTLDGIMLLGRHSGFQAGTSAAPVPFAQQGVISMISPPTLGTQYGPTSMTYGNSNCGKQSLIIYGQKPTTTIEYPLASAAAAGQKNIVLTTAPTDWSVGDRIYLPMHTYTGTQDNTLYVISSISGTTVTFTANINYLKYIGGPAINFERCGFRIVYNGASTNYSIFQSPDNFVLSGCEVNKFSFNTATQSGQWVNDLPANMSQYTIDTVFFFTTTAGGFIWSQIDVPANGVYWNKFYSTGGLLPPNTYTTQGALGIGSQSGSCTVDYSLSGGTTYGSGMYVRGANFIGTGNRFYNSYGNINQPWVSFGDGNFPAVAYTWQNNTFWSGNGATFGIYNAFNSVAWSGNSVNNCGAPYCFYTGASKNNVSTGDFYGNIVANSLNVYTSGSPLVDFSVNSFTGTLNFDPTQQKLMLPGSVFKESNYNSVTYDDRTAGPYGNTQRCGYGLGDTTTHGIATADGTPSPSKYSLRFAPNNSTNSPVFSQSYLTGNIQGYTMTVGVWCKISNAAFYAGTYQLPRLTVTYDNGTNTAYAVAGTAAGVWQYLFVPIAPTTTAGQITISVTAATDATGSNAYIYWADFAISPPPGITINNSGLASWADALPVTPTASNNPLSGSIWDEQTASHTGAGSYGQQANISNVEILNLPALLD